MVSLFVLGACGSSSEADDSESCPTGSPGCPCTAGGACDSDLLCEGMTCREPGPVAGQSGSGGTSGSAGAAGAAGMASSCVSACGDRVCGTDPGCADRICGACPAGLACVEGACQAAGPLTPNGETCVDDSECASGHCGDNMLGESRCYGSVGPNERCSDTYDCASGVCVSASLSGIDQVCSTGVVECVANDVSVECVVFVTRFCQLSLSCDPVSSPTIPDEYADYNFCIGRECAVSADGTFGLTDSECAEAVAFIETGTAPCP